MIIISKSKLIIVAILLILLKSGSFFSCSSQSAQQSPVKDDLTTIADNPVTETVEVDAITSATRSNSLPTFNGVLVIPPQRHATVTLFMDGVVKSTSLLSGMFVKKGEIIAVLENPAYITLQQMFIECSAQEEYLEAEYRRQEMLYSGEAASQKILQQSKADYLSMKSRREAASAQLNLLGFDPAQIIANGIIPSLDLRSPIDGYVANLHANIGKYIAEGNAICDIIDKNMAMLKLTVYEKDMEKIKLNDKIEFRANGLGARVFDATVISIGQWVDNVSRALEVYARANSSDPQFRPGMYINARIVEQ